MLDQRIATALWGRLRGVAELRPLGRRDGLWSRLLSG